MGVTRFFMTRKNTIFAVYLIPNHMKNIRIIILCFGFVLACCSLTGCGKDPDYDPRLTAADSLMHTSPDSALTLLSTIDGQQLGNAADRAYHALLLTEARYKCYITATSDSAINLALSHYERHSDELDKLTRAYIYKGAVMEELGDIQSAMRYFKKAGSIAPEGDHYLQGYIRLRQGNLYRDQLIADSSDVNLFKEALYHFKQVPDSFYILTCLSEIGSSYHKNCPDSVLPYLYQARSLARRLHENEIEIINEIFIGTFKAYSNDPKQIDEAKNKAISFINSGEAIDDMKDLLMIAALSLAKQNKPDSAAHYLEQASKLLVAPLDSQFFYRCQAEVARSRGNMEQFQLYYRKTMNLNETLITNRMQFQLREVEEKYDNEALKNEKLRYRSWLSISILITLLALSLAALIVTSIMRRSALLKQRLQENEDQIDRLHAETAELSTHLKADRIMNTQLKNAISHQIKVFTQLIEMHHTQFASNPKKFSELFEASYKGNEPDLSFWEGIRYYADSTHGGLITRLQEEYSELSESDLRVLGLCCCHLPTTVIMACMGYKDAHSVYNKKRRIASTLGLENRLDEYLLDHLCYIDPPENETETDTEQEAEDDDEVVDVTD